LERKGKEERPEDKKSLGAQKNSCNLVQKIRTVKKDKKEKNEMRKGHSHAG